MANLLADLLSSDSDSDDHIDDKAGAATAAAAAAVGSMGGGAGEMPAHPLGGDGALHAAPVSDAAASDTTWPAPPELPPEKPTKARRRWVPPEFDVEVGAGVEEEEADEPTDDEDISPSPATAAFVSPTPATRDLPTPPSRPTPSISQRPSQYNSDPAVADKPKTVSRPRTSRGRQTTITNLTPKMKRNRHLARSSRRSADIKIACKILYQRYVTQTTSPMNDAKWGR